MQTGMNTELNSRTVTRLSNQCSRILTLLASSPDGRVSNYELSAVSLKYTSRISELRKAGVNVVCVDHDKKTGLAHYAIQNEVAA
jgi:hypothetical protein